MKPFCYKIGHKLMLGDLYTPVSTYLKVRDFFSQSALMESADYHGGENNRSFICLHPIASIGINLGNATLRYPVDTVVEPHISEHYPYDDAPNDLL